MVTAVCTILGFALLIWVGRRKFYRTNQAGVQEYSSYMAALGSNVLEGGVVLLAGALLIFAALAA
ncbi:MAG: hypothetical protein GVY13_05710 [Alphaproteobacteria bacterium]|jgi:hypothetical protein|nr:hypothetical protein [Alphaproteobacteria bacterium]